MQVYPVDPERPDPAPIQAAASILRAGGLVAFPTETVYGLGANALDAEAVGRVFAAKGRPAHDPVIVHVLGVDDLGDVAASVPPAAAALAAAFWPGPLTLVVPRGAAVPDVVTAGLDSVAVRAPSHGVARALIAAAGVPVAAPSANPFGRASPTTAAHVVADLGDRVDVVLDAGPAPIGVESTVVDCRVDPPTVLRPGGVPLEALRRVVPGIRTADGGAVRGAAAPARAPGQLPRHYAPRARLVLVMGESRDVRTALAGAAAVLARSGTEVGLLVADEDVAAGVRGALGRGVHVASLGPIGDPRVAARRLFAALRALDDAGARVILARDFGTADLALAVRDRLTRAAEGRVVIVEPGGGADVDAAAAIVVLATPPADDAPA